MSVVGRWLPNRCAGDMFKLVIEDDEGRKTTVPLVRNEITVGRQDGNTIRLTEKNVSRQHARIFRDGGGLVIEDVSKYGTRRNGKRFSGKQPFSDSDTITIGDYRLTVRREVTDAPPASVEEFAASDTLPDIRISAPSSAGASASPARESHPPRFVCQSGPLAGRAFVLEKAEVVIGRADECDLVVDHPSISKRHARVVQSGESWRVEDLGSSNGIRINGEPYTKVELRRGDVVTLGSLKFRFSPAGDPYVFTSDANFEAIAPAPPNRRLGVVIGAVSLLVIGGIAAALLSGDDPPAAPPSAPVATAPAAAPPVAAPVAAEAPAAEPGAGEALRSAQVAMKEGRWKDAVAALDKVPEADPNHDLAGSLKKTAVAEQANEEIYREITGLLDRAEFQAALQRIDSIPVGTYYRTRIADEKLERRAVTGMVDQALAQAQELHGRGDTAEAIRTLRTVEPVAPEDARIPAALAQLESRGGRPAAAVAAASATQPARPGTAPSRPAAAPAVAASARPAAAPAAVHNTPPVRPVQTPTPSPAPKEPAAPAAEKPGGSAAELKAQARQAGVKQQHRDAIKLLEQARELAPTDADINLMLFGNYRAVGNNFRAAGAIRRFLQQRPNDPKRAEYERWLQQNDPDGGK